MFHVAVLSRSFNSLAIEIQSIGLASWIDLRTANSTQQVIDSIIDRIESVIPMVPNSDELQEDDVILVTPFVFGAYSESHRWYRIESHTLVQVDPAIGALEFRRIVQY